MYVTGITGGTNRDHREPGECCSDNIFLTKYDSSGIQQWIRQIGTSEDDSARGVAVDSSGNVYVTGQSNGIFLAKYDSSGSQQWIKQIGTSEWDTGQSVAVDSSGNVYVTGHFLAKYNSNGTERWFKEIGFAVGRSVAVDSSGNAYVTGQYRSEEFPQGVRDVFLIKCDTVWAQNISCRDITPKARELRQLDWDTPVESPRINKMFAADVSDRRKTDLDEVIAAMVYLFDGGFDANFYITGADHSLNIPLLNDAAQILGETPSEGSYLSTVGTREGDNSPHFPNELT